MYNEESAEAYLDYQTRYIQWLKELAKSDPEKAKEIAKAALVRAGIIDADGNLKAPYNGENVNPDDFTRGPR